MLSSVGVVVVAASLEGIDALARLISQLSLTFPLPVVVHVHRSPWEIIVRLKSQKWRSASRLDVMRARVDEPIIAGRVYILPAGENLCFTAIGILSRASNTSLSSADQLFASAARWYQSGTIGIVLSGLGTDGTQGLREITRVEGTRIIQSPSEATFSSMPTSALMGDHVQHSVLLDQMGNLLTNVVEKIAFSSEIFPKNSSGRPRRVLTSGEQQTESLDRSIVGILTMMREQLNMDIVLVTKTSGDDVVISHSTDSLSNDSIQGMSLPKDQTLCQRVLEGHLPGIMPDVEKMRLTHDVPPTPIPVGAYMSAPVWLNTGELFGTLCSVNTNPTPDLDQRQYQRLLMSARQIARLVNEAGMPGK